MENITEVCFYYIAFKPKRFEDKQSILSSMSSKEKSVRQHAPTSSTQQYCWQYCTAAKHGGPFQGRKSQKSHFSRDFNTLPKWCREAMATTWVCRLEQRLQRPYAFHLHENWSLSEVHCHVHQQSLHKLAEALQLQALSSNLG